MNAKPWLRPNLFDILGPIIVLGAVYWFFPTYFKENFYLLAGVVLCAFASIKTDKALLHLSAENDQLRQQISNMDQYITELRDKYLLDR